MLNQPNISVCASWNLNGITIKSSNTVGELVEAIFVDQNNTLYAAPYTKNNLLVWSENGTNLIRNISGNWAWPQALFVTNNGDIYVDNGWGGTVEKVAVGSTNSISVMSVSAQCSGLFVDRENTLYCSMRSKHQVLKASLNQSGSSSIVAAGNGSGMLAANTLNQPYGIFVDTDFTLYVADCQNNRIQSFRPNEEKGKTIAGQGTTNTYPLKCPVGVVLDRHGHFYIADRAFSRIITSVSGGFRCIIGCPDSKLPVKPLNKLASIAFDRYGNIFVADVGKNQVQLFNLEANTCGMFQSL